MEPIDVAKKINFKIIELDELVLQLPSLAQKKAVSLAQYDKEIEKATLRLKEEGIPATLIEKLAKGQCSQFRLEQDLAESMYKNAIEISRIKQAQMNGFQSINRYLSEV